MPVFKFVIANPKTRKTYNVELDQEKGVGLIGKKIRDKFSGDILGLSGYELQITGGTDKDGFPMHPLVHGAVRKKIILSHPPCFHPKRKGERRRKTVRGNTISQDIVQINCKIIKEGKTPIEEILVKKEKKLEEVKKEPEKKVEEKPKEEVEKKKEVEPKEKIEKPKEELKPKEEVKTKEEIQPKEVKKKE